MTKSPRSFAVFAFAVFVGVLLAGSAVWYVERVNRKREIAALSDAKLLGLAALEYAQDHNGRYPNAGRWEMELTPYLLPNIKGVPGIPSVEGIFCPPGPMGSTSRRFSLNPALAGKSLAQVNEPSSTWLFYESVSKQPSAGDNLGNWPDLRQDGSDIAAVVWGDGHCYSRSADWKQGSLQHLPGF